MIALAISKHRAGEEDGVWLARRIAGSIRIVTCHVELKGGLIRYGEAIVRIPKVVLVGDDDTIPVGIGNMKQVSKQRCRVPKRSKDDVDALLVAAEGLKLADEL